MRAIAALLFLTLGCVSAIAVDTPILPSQFAGWVKGTSKQGADPAVIDPAFAAVLKEFGFTDFETATYTKPERKLEVKAARFADATGAYGAFTFYKREQMLNEKFGDQGASLNERALFYRGNVLIDAVFDKLTAMSAAELREFSEMIPVPAGPARNLPTLPSYLPRESYVKNTAKYVLGPAALAYSNSPVPAQLIDFQQNPEIALGQYNTANRGSVLMLIAYPTPQIAAERLRAIEAQVPQQTGGAVFAAKRSGPILAVVNGQISRDDATALLARVNYDANVTWNEPTFLRGRENIGNLIINAFILIGIIILLAVGVGIAFGAVRLVTKRIWPDKVFDRPEDVEIIRLNLGR
jgi:hypothetical protein